MLIYTANRLETHVTSVTFRCRYEIRDYFTSFFAANHAVHFPTEFYRWIKLNSGYETELAVHRRRVCITFMSRCCQFHHAALTSCIIKQKSRPVRPRAMCFNKLIGDAVPSLDTHQRCNKGASYLNRGHLVHPFPSQRHFVAWQQLEQPFPQSSPPTRSLPCEYYSFLQRSLICKGCHYLQWRRFQPKCTVRV